MSGAHTVLSAPLEGIRVLEYGSSKAVKLATRYLSGYGAEVTMVGVDSPIVHDEHATTFFDTGKASADPRDADELLALASSVDVVVTDQTIARRVRAGIGPDVLRAGAPTLIVVSVTPFGEAGIGSEWPATPLTEIAGGGQIATMGDPDREPLAPYGNQAEAQAALHVFDATLAALIRRSRYGIGSTLDLSIQELQASALELLGGMAFNGDEAPAMFTARGGNEFMPTQSYYQCADGWAGAFVNPPNLPSLWAALGRPEFAERAATDPDFVGGEELRAIIADFFRQRTKEQVMEAAIEFGAPFSYVADASDLLGSEIIGKTGLWREITDRAGNRVIVPGPPLASALPFEV